MRILHLTSHLDIGGVSSYVLWVSRALAQRGHRVLIVSGGGPLEARLDGCGITHWRLPLHTSVEFSPQVFWAVRRLGRGLRREPVDLLHAHTRVGQVAAAALSRRLRIPYVTTWHGFFRPNLGRRLWPCTGVLTIAISEPVRRHLLEDFGLPAERIRCIPHGIDPAPFEAPPDPIQQQRLRARLGLPQDGPVVGTIARLVPSKRVDELIRCLPQIRTSIPAARLLIVGDGEERQRLAGLARSMGVAEAVCFAGALPETPAVLSLMDVFVFLPAEQEGFGLSLLEAMASGRPIVAVRRGGGAPWVLEQGGAGTVVEPGDFQALASAIVRFLEDREAARHAAERARAVVRERFTLSRMVDQLEAVYRELGDR